MTDADRVLDQGSILQHKEEQLHMRFPNCATINIYMLLPEQKFFP